MAKKTWHYDKYLETAQSPALDCIALADLKLRESPEDPKNLVPPSAKAKASIKAGTKFKCDKLGLMGTITTPSDEASGFVRAVWYHIPASEAAPAGWVLGYYQAPANSGKVENYVGVGEDGLMTWAGIQGAKDLEKKKKEGSTTPATSTTPTTPPPFTKPPVDGAKAGMTPLLIIAVLAAVYLFTQRKSD